MRGPDHKQSSLFSYTNIEDRIAVDHPLRRVKVMADMVLHSMSPTFDSLYAEGGRPSIAPERLLRALLLQCNRSLSGVLPPPGLTRKNPPSVQSGGTRSDQRDDKQQQAAAA